ncbi:hypothetical protein RSAG8_03795, partial [Rhizoctonia solani AG-8 WAC10335]
MHDLHFITCSAFLPSAALDRMDHNDDRRVKNNSWMTARIPTHLHNSQVGYDTNTSTRHRLE